MKDKKWAMISALVGFIGGGFSVLSPFLLTFAQLRKVIRYRIPFNMVCGY